MEHSVKPEALGFVKVSASTLSGLERRIYDIILDHWPTSALEIAGHFNEETASREQRKRVSTRYSYYLRKLVGKRLVFSKRMGNSLIVWPLRAEKYRALHGILTSEEP